MSPPHVSVFMQINGVYETGLVMYAVTRIESMHVRCASMGSGQDTWVSG